MSGLPSSWPAFGQVPGVWIGANPTVGEGVEKVQPEQVLSATTSTADTRNLRALHLSHRQQGKSAGMMNHVVGVATLGPTDAADDGGVMRMDATAAAATSGAPVERGGVAPPATTATAAGDAAAAAAAGGGGNVAKVRKPYTITKQRERWTEEEHQRFLTALKLHGRAWRKIEEHIGTKSAVQIRSHAQKFFSKLQREAKRSAGAGDGGAGVEAGSSGFAGVSDEAAQLAVTVIPPARPKRKPAHPYPRKASSRFQSTGNGAVALENAENMQTLGNMEAHDNDPNHQRANMMAQRLQHGVAGADTVPGNNIMNKLAGGGAGAGPLGIMDFFSQANAASFAAAHMGAVNAHAVAMQQHQHLPPLLPLGGFLNTGAGVGDGGAMMANAMMAAMAGRTGVDVAASVQQAKAAAQANAAQQFFATLATLQGHVAAKAAAAAAAAATGGAAAAAAAGGGGGEGGILAPRATPPAMGALRPVTVSPAVVPHPPAQQQQQLKEEGGGAEVQRPTAAHVNAGSPSTSTGARPPPWMPPLPSQGQGQGQGEVATALLATTAGVREGLGAATMAGAAAATKGSAAAVVNVVHQPAVACSGPGQGSGTWPSGIGGGSAGDFFSAMIAAGASRAAAGPSFEIPGATAASHAGGGSVGSAFSNWGALAAASALHPSTASSAPGAAAAVHPPQPPIVAALLSVAPQGQAEQMAALAAMMMLFPVTGTLGAQLHQPLNPPHAPHAQNHQQQPPPSSAPTPSSALPPSPLSTARLTIQPRPTVLGGTAASPQQQQLQYHHHYHKHHHKRAHHQLDGGGGAVHATTTAAATAAAAANRAERSSRLREQKKANSGGGGVAKVGKGGLVSATVAFAAADAKTALTSGSDGSGSSAQTAQQHRGARWFDSSPQHGVVEESSQRETSPLSSEQQQ